MIRVPRNLLALSIVLPVAALVLPGCLSTPPSSMIRLARLSPLEADPGQIRIAVIHDGILRVREGDVTLKLAYEPDGKGPSFDEHYKPVVSANQSPPPELAGQKADSQRLTVMHLSARDAVRMREVQSAIRDYKQAGGDGAGTLAAAVEGCLDAAGPDGPVLVSTYLKTADGDTFFALVRNQDMRKLLAKQGVDIAGMEPCTPDGEAATPTPR